MMNTNKDKTKVSAPGNAQLWRELRQMTAQRDELLAALKSITGMESYAGEVMQIIAKAAIAKCEAQP